MVNFFPYTQLWRINKEPASTNKCTTIASILVVLAIGGLFASRIKVAIDRTEMTYNSQTILDDFPVKSTISTYLDQLNPQPFMLGIDVQSANQGFDASNLNISAYASTLLGTDRDNRTEIYAPIALEKCTPAHFTTFPNIASVFESWKASNWWCLPLNKTFTIQGSWALNGNFSSIDISFECSGSCTEYSQGLNIWLYALQTILNPNNSTQPQQHFISELVIPIQPKVFQAYTYSMTENVLVTDRSLYPWQDKQTTRSWQVGQLKNDNTLHNQSTWKTDFYIQRSSKTIIITRQYLKFLQVFSYIGGNVQAVFGAFFFMSIIGKILFEFIFAESFFRCKEAKNFGALRFITQIVYKVLTAINCEPEWKGPRKLAQYQKTVNNLLDISYLQKRIDFLETALSIMLEDYQLQALHLCQNVSRAKTDLTYKRHQLRDRLIYFFRDQLVDEPEEATINNSMPLKKTQTQQPIKKNIDLIERSPDKSSRNKKEITPKKGNKPVTNQLQKYQPKNTEKTINVSQEIIVSNPKSMEDRRVDKERKKMKEALRKVGEMPPEILKEHQLREWIPQTFGRLIRDISERGDERSLKIYSGIEDWLKQLLQDALRKNRGYEEQKKPSRVLFQHLPSKI